jgi:hypothetical protein
MKQKIIVTFDIADQSFKVFNMQQWENYIAELRDQLVGDYIYEDDEEVIEVVHGDELFWEELEVEQI